jgi:hypothetical protein
MFLDAYWICGTRPAGASTWLHEVHDHWNGFGSVRFATAGSLEVS